MEISIIVPVYNAEKYLERCLDSILKSLEGISGEILTVDNGSTDSSLSILEKYKRKFPKLVRVLQCHTPGAAAVRNYGVLKSHGKYIWFIDADDEITEDAVRKLLEVAKIQDTDMIMLGAKRVFPDHEDYLSPVSTDKTDYKSRFIRYGMGPWQVLIRREWWENHGFKLREGIIHEDMELMSALILYTDKFSSVDEPLYIYYQNTDSVLHKSEFSPHIFDIFPALEGLYERFREAKAEKKYHDELEWFFIWNLLIDSAKDFAKFPEGRPGFSHSREMLKKYFPKWRKNRFLKKKPLRLKVRVRLNYFK